MSNRSLKWIIHFILGGSLLFTVPVQGEDDPPGVVEDLTGFNLNKTDFM